MQESKADEIARRAAAALRGVDEKKRELRVSEAALTVILQEYASEVRLWGWTADMMRRACEARGFSSVSVDEATQGAAK